MAELERIDRSVSEAQIIEDFGKYEGIHIERIDKKTVKATFQEAFGEGSVIGDSVLNVLLNAVRRQKTQEYWRGFNKAEEEGKTILEEALQDNSERLEELTASIALLRETTDTAVKHLAGYFSHLERQISVDHQQSEAL